MMTTSGTFNDEFFAAKEDLPEAGRGNGVDRCRVFGRTVGEES